MDPQICPHLDISSEEYVASHDRRSFGDVIKVKDFEMARRPLWTQSTHMSL